MNNRILILSFLGLGIASFAAPIPVGAANEAAPQGIEAPSAYLESIENPGDGGGVEDADAAAAAAVAAEHDAGHDEANDPKQD